jgi:beta-glucosidase
MIPAAVAAAKAADVVVLFVGTNPSGNVASCPTPPRACVKTTEGEAVDRISLGLPGVQAELTRAVVGANPRTVLIMMNAGPLAIEWEKLHVPAIVESYFPGEMGGDAIAAVLYGDHAPAGRLPVTIYPRNYTTRNMTDYDLTSHEGTTHLHYTGTPLWSFGWGMGYTTFKFEIVGSSGNDASVAGAENLATPGHHSTATAASFTAVGVASGLEPIVHMVRVTNTGGMRSAVSVQAFVSSEHPDAPANSKLYDFNKTRVLLPGEHATLQMTLRPGRLALVNDNGDERIAAGEYTVRIGGAGSGLTRDADFSTSTFAVAGPDVAMWELTAAKRRWEQSQ